MTMATRLPRQDDDDIRNRKPRTLEEAIVRTQGPSRTMRPSLDSRSRTPMPLPMPRNMGRLPASPMTRLPAPRLPMPGQRPVPIAQVMPDVRPGRPAPGFGRLPAPAGPGAGQPVPSPMPAPQAPVPPRGNVGGTGVAWDFLDAHPVLRDLLQSLQGAGPQASQMQMPMAIEQILGQVQQPQFSPGTSDQAWMDWQAEGDEEDEQAAAQEQLASALQALGLV